MYSSEDFERFYFQYQTEAVPHGVSIQTFCLRNKVPYNLFSKWYKDTRKKIVEVGVDGAPDAVSTGESSLPEPTVAISQTPGASMDCPASSPVRIFSRDPYEYGTSYFSKELRLSGFMPADREIGGIMLSVTGIHHFYYLRDFTDMRCKHSRILSVIREQLHREPAGGDVFIVMSKNRRIVRMFTYDNRSYSLFEKKFVSGYQFMKVIRRGDETFYRIDWKDVVLLLENPIVKELKIR